MKYNQLIFGILIGAVAAHLWHRKDWKKSKSKDGAEKISFDVITGNAVAATDPLVKDYKIDITPNKYSKKVKEKAKEFTDRRYNIVPANIKPEVYL